MEGCVTRRLYLHVLTLGSNDGITPDLSGGGGGDGDRQRGRNQQPAGWIGGWVDRGRSTSRGWMIGGEGALGGGRTRVRPPSPMRGKRWAVEAATWGVVERGKGV
jgi:hypothetical protein